MITVSQSRKKSGGQNYDQGTFFVDLPKAIERLLVFELGYCGRITGINATTIIVTTNMLGDIDTTTFSGEESEMAPLVEMVYFFLKISEEFKEEIFSASFHKSARLENLHKEYEGVSPLFMQLGFPIVMGENRVKAAIMYGLGIKEKEDLTRGLLVRLPDILAAIELKNECGCTFAEALC